ncbi:MAG: hypothetical protein PHT91_03750, partial [Candidatus Nanoarchaeia archaeon]|nr:hypothetical protein [Candidatus Nanoarchaeia archaeon]
MAGGGFENAKSTLTKRPLNIGLFYGECYFKRNGVLSPLKKTSSGTMNYLVNGKMSTSWRKVEKAKEDEGLILRDGDSLVTKKNGHIMNIGYSLGDGKEGISITLFPDSEVLLHMKTVKKSDKFRNNDGSTGENVLESDIIKSFELIRGLFSVSIETAKEIFEVMKINSKYPSISFKPAHGKWKKMKSLSFTIELLPDNSLVLLNIFNHVVIHNKLGIEAKAFEAFKVIGKPKITVTHSGIYLTDLSKHPDFRAEAIEKRVMDLWRAEASKGMAQALNDLSSSENRNMLLKERIRSIKQELTNERCKDEPNLKIIAFLEKQLLSAPSVLVSNETKSIYNKIIDDNSPALQEIETPLPSYSAVSEEDKVLKKKDVARTSKSYDSLISEKADKNAEFAEEMQKIGVNPGQVESYMRKQSKGESIPPKVANLIAKIREFNTDFESSVSKLTNDKGITAQTVSSKVNAKATLNNTLLKFTK